MKKFSRPIFFLFTLSLFVNTVNGQDRNPQTNILFPDELTIGQGGKNIYNIKNPPDGNTAAVGDGITDDTQAFIDAYNYIAYATDSVAGMSWEQMGSNFFPTEDPILRIENGEASISIITNGPGSSDHGYTYVVINEIVFDKR